MGQFEIVNLLLVLLFVALIIAIYMNKLINNKLKLSNSECDNLINKNNDEKIENIRLNERIDYQDKLLANADLDKEIQEGKLKMAEIEKEAAESKEQFIKANERMETMQESTSAVTNENQEKIGFLFGNSNIQGEYGENSLELVFKEVYFVEGINYFKSKKFPYSDANGKLCSAIPDFVVPRPSKDGSGIMNVIVDSKTPLSDFHEWYKAKKENAKNTELKKLEDSFIKKIHGHAKILSERNYTKYVDSAFGIIIMYVPIEEMVQLVSASRKKYRWDNKEQTINEYLHGKNIWIHSRTQILGVFDVIKHMFDIKNQTDHVKSIVDVARDLVSITDNIKRGTEKYIASNEKETKRIKKILKDNNTEEYTEKVNILGLSEENKKISNKTVLHLVDNDHEENDREEE